LLDRIGGGAVGIGLSHNVLAAYRYLAQHYLPVVENLELSVSLLSGGSIVSSAS
jgi:hypothetical protein